MGGQQKNSQPLLRKCIQVRISFPQTVDVSYGVLYESLSEQQEWCLLYEILSVQQETLYGVSYESLSV